MVNEGSNFLRGRFSNRDNKIAQIQKRKKTLASSKIIFHQGQTHAFLHINSIYSNSQMKQVEFPQQWYQQATFYPSRQCLTGQILADPLRLVTSTNQPINLQWITVQYTIKIRNNGILVKVNSFPRLLHV